MNLVESQFKEAEPFADFKYTTCILYHRKSLRRRR